MPLPNPDMVIDPKRTALVITDPQNDFLSPDGVTWNLVGQNVTENGTVQNIEDLLKAAKETGMPVFISPHYYFPHDHSCKFECALETDGIRVVVAHRNELVAVFYVGTITTDAGGDFLAIRHRSELAWQSPPASVVMVRNVRSGPESLLLRSPE